METGLVFTKQGTPICWHTPPERSDVYLPDSRDLWEILWDHRKTLGGVAHTHLCHGPSAPSMTDVTTFAAVEQGLGARLTWPIVTFTTVGYFVWAGPGKHAYSQLEQGEFKLSTQLINQLRGRSR
jgi:hypothetical protein